jgi:antitoxin (DNA-binding transcriptional repressor) of toxin-antitoxin stability system
MKTIVTSTHLVRNLGDCLARVRYRGETFVIKKNDEIIAEMIPSGGSGGATWAELASVVAAYPADADFAADLERVNQLDSPPENPWD